MRFVFTPPADHAAGLLTLPWSEPLAEWHDERLVEIRQRGISRHVVRFVYDDGELYALKELNERLARREYRLLRALAELNIPAVEVVGVAVDRDGAGPRPPELDAVLVSKFLSYARAAGQPADAPAGSVAADALAPRRVGELVFPITQSYVDDVLLVDDASILAAQQALWRAFRVAAEPAASVGIAALLAGAYKPAPGEQVAVVISGANMDPAQLGAHLGA